MMKRLHTCLGLVFLTLFSACGHTPNSTNAGLTTASSNNGASAEPGAPLSGGEIPITVTESSVATGAAAVSTPKLEAITNTQYLPKALELIRGAQNEIELAQFEYAYGNAGDAIAQLQTELAKAVERGVKVHVLLDEEVEKTRFSLPYLLKLGMDAKLDSPRKRTHTKLLLVDRRKALFGSSNWSDASLMKTNEANICVVDDRLGAELHEYFQFLCNHSDDDYQHAPVVAPGITIYFDREYEATLTERLTEANTIDLQLYAARLYADDSSSPSSKALTMTAAAAGRGKHVRAIIEQSDYNDAGNGFNDASADFLTKAGAVVKRDPLDKTSHAKMLLTDKGVLFGSSNWGFKAFRQEHDLNAYVTDPATVAMFRLYYEQLWSQAQARHGVVP